MKNIVVLTGAGMSAESGLSTFRDSGGLWDRYKIDDVATPDGWRKDSELVLEFYNKRRKQLLEVEPNEGHITLAQLENNFTVHIITQNIDNLHERAGSTNILHLHGELMKARSTGEDHAVYELNDNHLEIHMGDKCPKGSQLRPHIVWFGEEVFEIDNAKLITEKADVFVIIGTSLQVYPAAGLLNFVRPGVPVYLIDPNQVQNLPSNVTIIQKGGSEGVKLLSTLLRQYA